MHNGPDVNTYASGADLRQHKHKLAAMNAAGAAVLASGGWSDGQRSQIGIIWTAPGPSGASVGIAQRGIGDAIAGGAIASLQLLTSDAAGLAVVANSGDLTIGQALTSTTTSGEFVEILLRVPGVRLTF